METGRGSLLLSLSNFYSFPCAHSRSYGLFDKSDFYGRAFFENLQSLWPVKKSHDAAKAKVSLQS